MKFDRKELYWLFHDRRFTQYSVPNYQRLYGWEEKNCATLWNDIMDLTNNPDPHATHFLGVIIRKELGDGSYSIIDGQQRLTTIYLLMKAIYDSLPKNNPERDYLEDRLFNKPDRHHCLGAEERLSLKIKTYRTDEQALTKLMYDGISSETHIWKNYNYFVTNMRGMSEAELEDIIEAIKKLDIAVIDIDNEDPQIIYDRINSTGLPLTPLDKICNYLLMDIGDESDYYYETYWTPFHQRFQELNMESAEKISKVEDDFINTFCDFKERTSTPRKSRHNYETFKMLYKTAEDKKAALKELVTYGAYFCDFVQPEKCSYSPLIKNYLIYIKDIVGNHFTHFPYFYAIFDAYSNNTISENDIIKILQTQADYISCYKIAQTPATIARSVYINLVNEIRNKESFTFIQEKDSLCKNIKQCHKITPKELIEKAIFCLKNEDIYTKRKSGLIKYILSSVEYEGRLTKEFITSLPCTLEVEHTMPQTLSEDWKKMVGSDSEKFLNKLGNLTLTTENESLYNRPFSLKKNYYEKSKFINLNKDIIAENIWNESAILKRTNILSNKIGEIFSSHMLA